MARESSACELDVTDNEGAPPRARTPNHFFFGGLELTAFPVTFSKTAPPTRKMVRSSAGPRTNPPGAKYHPNHASLLASSTSSGVAARTGEDAKMPADPTAFRATTLGARGGCAHADATRRCATGLAMCAPTRTRVWTMDAAQDMDYATAVGASE